MNNEILKTIITIIGLIISACGITFIFDARKISKKWFSFGDRNEGAKTLKILGFIIAIVGGIIVII